MAQQEQVAVPPQVEPFILAVTSVGMIVSEEEFVLQIQSGQLVRRYSLTPKHAKRVLLLLQSNIEAYEKQIGELKTSLPVAGQGEQKTVGFQIPQGETGGASVLGTEPQQ